MKKFLGFCLSVALLSGCASQQSTTIKTETAYYQDANTALKAGSYSAAAEGYEALESQYPVGFYTQQAQLELIYARLMQADYASAIAAADRYLRLHPSANNIDYVLYLRGLANYNIDQDAILRRLPINMAHRDLGQAKVAFTDFTQLITRFPNSPYAADARQRMIHLRNQFAESELHVARYYKTRGATVAVINRARWVVENYPESASVPEALDLLIEGYRELGMKDLAEQAEQLRANNAKAAS